MDKFSDWHWGGDHVFVVLTLPVICIMFKMHLAQLAKKNQYSWFLTFWWWCFYTYVFEFRTTQNSRIWRHSPFIKWKVYEKKVAWFDAKSFIPITKVWFAGHCCKHCCWQQTLLYTQCVKLTKKSLISREYCGPILNLCEHNEHVC